MLGTRRYRQARRRVEAIRDRAGDPVAPSLDRATPALAFSDLFEYRRKRALPAYLLWLVGGLLGAHRFYLDREGTAVAQFLTGGGLLVWWAADAFLLPSMVRAYNRDQAERKAEGRPPRSLDFLETVPEDERSEGTDSEGSPSRGENRGSEAGGLDALSGGDDPDWARGRSMGRARVAVDVAVVAFAGLMLGAVSGETGSWRAAAAVASIILAVGFAPELSALRRLPGAGDLLRWAARLGLFYRHHDPGGPLARLARPIVGAVLAPFRGRARAEVHLYLEIGGAFAILFFCVDLAVVAVSGLGGGQELAELPARWGTAALTTLINVYAFASPVGATLYEHALAGHSHRRVWLLGGTALAALAAGTVAGLAAA